MPITLNRRHILAGLPVLVTGLRAIPAAAEPPPEVTSVRLPVYINASDCQAPLYIAETLLHGEGITDVQWVGVKFGEGMSDFKAVTPEDGSDSADWIRNDLTDFDWNFPPGHIRNIAIGAPIKVLAGIHVGCLELFANDTIRGVADLKGKRVGVDLLTGVSHQMLIAIVASVGLDPYKDIEWFTDPEYNPVEMFAEGKIDAFLGFPPEPQEMRSRKLGHVILSTSIDKPWSQYYCCMLSARGVRRKNPVATKRTFRAVLKSADLCVADPQPPPRRWSQGLRQQLRLCARDADGRHATARGGITIRRTRCASGPFGCRRRASSRTIRRRSSPTAPTGAFSTSSSAS